MKKSWLFLFTGLLILMVLGLAFAGHVITTFNGGGSFNPNEDFNFLYNISVNNTDNTTNANITQVNITLPGSFSFTAGSNGTDATGVFANTSTILTWNNDGMIMNLTRKYFWFNATASTPGEYNITITTLNTTGAYSSDISISVNDTTVPNTITLASPTTSSGNISKSYIEYNVTATDNGILDRIIVRLYNSTHNEINSSSSATSPVSGNFSGLSDGVYYLNASVNDTFNNVNSTNTRTIELDTTNPQVTIDAPDNTTYDDNDDINIEIFINEEGYCKYSFNGGGSNFTLTASSDNKNFTKNLGELSANSYILNVYCNDSAGNNNYSSAVYFLVNASSSSSSSSSGGGDTAPVPEVFWLNTQVLLDLQFEEGFTKLLSNKFRFAVKIGEETHHVGVVEITSTTSKINVSSDPQQATFNIGDEKKFEVTGDNYYDILVKLNGITNLQANVTVKKINEEMPKQEPTAQPIVQDIPVTTTGKAADTPEEPEDDLPENKRSKLSLNISSWFSKLWNSFMWIIIVLIVLIVLFLIMAGVAYYMLHMLRHKKVYVSYGG